MKAIDAMWLLSEIAGEYLSNYQKSWDWLRGLNNGIYGRDRIEYLKQRLLSEGMVSDKAGSGLTLLIKGRNELFREFPLLKCQNKKWDGKWRVVMYDIPENQRLKRDILRRWLKKLGFGQWQISVWVSPHPLVNEVSKVLTNAGLNEFCSVHESQRKIGVSDMEFAEHVWQLNDLNKKYLGILKKFENSKRKVYLELLMNDPMLPKELLPHDWAGDSLKKRVIQN